MTSTKIIEGAGLDLIAWEATTPVYKRFVTDKQYRRFSEEAQRWYRPYRCANCEAREAAVDDGPADHRIASAVRKLKLLKHDFSMKGANATTIERAIDLLRSFGRTGGNGGCDAG